MPVAQRMASGFAGRLRSDLRNRGSVPVFGSGVCRWAFITGAVKTPIVIGVIKREQAHRTERRFLPILVAVQYRVRHNVFDSFPEIGTR